MIRTFNLMNSEGVAHTLTIANKYNGFLSTVDGLGYEEAPEYQQIGNAVPVLLAKAIAESIINQLNDSMR